MVMLYEGEDFANAERASERPPRHCPTGRDAAANAAAVHNGVDIPWLSRSVGRTSCMAIFFPAASSTAAAAAAAEEH